MALSPLALSAEEIDTFKPQAFRDYRDAQFVKDPLPPISKGSYTIAVLPDTQRYAKDNPQGFLKQTTWITQQREARNIAFTLHLGDITDNNLPTQWEFAKSAMTQLDNSVPYIMTLGNHDYSEDGKCFDRTTLYNEYFPLEKYSKLPTFGGVYDKEPKQYQNSYHLIEAGTDKWLILALEFGPRNDVIRWANEVVAKHQDRRAILITHAYMYFNDTRYDFAKYGKRQHWSPHAYPVAQNTNNDVNDGQELWDKLISKHPNFAMVLNGHVGDDGLGRLSTPLGTTQVHQMLVNFQFRPNGGDTWLRLIEMKTDNSAIVTDYSPSLEQWNQAPENHFTLKW